MACLDNPSSKKSLQEFDKKEENIWWCGEKSVTLHVQKK